MNQTLILSTSTTQGSIALGDEGKIIQEISWHKEKSHSEKITIHLQELLKSAGTDLSKIKLLICSRGPGSFTGIRVGLSVIKTLSYAYNLPIIALDDCYAVALNALMNSAPLPIAVVLDAQKNKVFLGLYKIENNNLITVMNPELVGLDELNAHLKENQYLCLGDGYDKFLPFLSEDITKKLLRDLKVSDFPIAATIYKSIAPHSEKFEKIKWSDIEPLYLRDSAAEEVLAAKTKKS